MKYPKINILFEFMKRKKRKLCHSLKLENVVGYSRISKPVVERKSLTYNLCEKEKQESVAMIYRSELNYISRCILDFKDNETGGQLFGFWTATGIPVVIYAIGPGLHANHQIAFFNQDIDYLKIVGEFLLHKYGLQHIGEWHSHHQLGLAHPSGHDASNMQTVIDKKHLGKFLLCIGNCTRISSTLNAFNFVENCSNYQQASWVIKETESPYRNFIDRELVSVLVHPHCQVPNMVSLKILDEDKPKFAQSYWLNSKQNNLELKRIIDFLNQYEFNSGCNVKIDASGHVHVFLETYKNGKKEIYFPADFPVTPPKVIISNAVVDGNWEYKGRIYDAFVDFYSKNIKGI